MTDAGDDQAPKKRSAGRPPKYAGEGKRQVFKFRIRDQIRDRLIEIARETGRSLSEEIEWRIERSLEWEEAFVSVRATLEHAKKVAADNLPQHMREHGYKAINTIEGRIWLEPGVSSDAVPDVVAAIERAIERGLEKSLPPAVEKALKPATGKSAPTKAA